MKVTFLGAGVYGKALGNLAESNGHEVKYYDPYKLPDVKLEDVAKDVDLLVYVAPGSAVESVVNAKNGENFIISDETPLLCASKGIATPYPFRRLKNFTALNGAAFAEDIETDSPRIGDKILLTSSSEKAEELFTALKIGIEYFEDTRGIMLCGALKVLTSVYAGYENPGGFVDLEGTPESVKAPEAPRATKTRQDFLVEIQPEWEKWLEANNCSKDLIRYSCGFPDVLISTTPSSRNFVYGQKLRLTGAAPEGTVEGVTIAKTLKNYPDLVIPEDSVLAEFAKKLIAVDPPEFLKAKTEEETPKEAPVLKEVL